MSDVSEMTHSESGQPPRMRKKHEEQLARVVGSASFEGSVLPQRKTR